MTIGDFLKMIDTYLIMSILGLTIIYLFAQLYKLEKRMKQKVEELEFRIKDSELDMGYLLVKLDAYEETLEELINDSITRSLNK